MNKIIKRLTALLLSLLLIFGTVSITVMSYDSLANLYVHNIYKVNCNAEAHTCYTIAVMFSHQFCNYDSSVKIEILDESSNAIAYCTPRSDDINIFDIYTADNDAFGVTLLPEREYKLVIPEGAIYTDSNCGCNEYMHIFTGVNLSGANHNYTISDLGITTFFPTKYTDDILYKGKLYFNSDFDVTDDDNCTITLTIVSTEDDEYIYTPVSTATVINLDSNGCAELSFGSEGVTIDKYESYRIIVSYASFYNNDNTFCAESVYDLSGKKLLKLREDYPAIDMLVKWFGKDHKIIDILLTVLKYSSKIKIVSSDYYNDIKSYIKAK